jgi:hypothetical protein
MRQIGVYIFLTGLIILAVGAGMIMLNLNSSGALMPPKGL